MKKIRLLVIFLILLANISNAIQYVPTGQVTNQSAVPGKTATDAFNYLYRTYIPKGGLAGQVWISLGTTDSYGQTNGYWGTIEGGDGGTAVYYPERRLFSGLQELDVSGTIRGQATADDQWNNDFISSGTGFEPSDCVWNFTEEKIYVVGDDGGIMRMNFDGSIREISQQTASAPWNGTKNDFEAVTWLEDYPSYIFVGAERFSSTGHDCIIKVDFDDQANNSKTVVWDIDSLFSDNGDFGGNSGANRGLEAMTFIPYEDLPSWCRASSKITPGQGLFLIADQNSGLLHLLNVPLNDTSWTDNGGAHVLTSNDNVVASWTPDFGFDAIRKDLSGMYWDKEYNIAYLLYDGDTGLASDLKDPVGDIIGTHNGGANQTILTDTTKEWTNDLYIGWTIYNTTKLASDPTAYGKISANDETTITAVKSDGNPFDWDNSDSYTLARGHTLYAYDLETKRVLIEWDILDGDGHEDPEGFTIGPDRNSIYICNDSAGANNIYRYRFEVRGDHDLRPLNVIMSRNPDADDDVTLKYMAGSMWFNLQNNTQWLAQDVTDGAAVWVELGGGNKIKISGDDSTPDYGEQKIIAGQGIVVTILNPGANEQLSISTYISPTVSLGSDVVTEMGGSIIDPTISWDVNKTMTSIVLSRSDLGTIHSTSGGDGSYPHTSTFTSAKTYSILVDDGDNTASDSKVYNFYWGKYVGMSETESNILDAEILTFTRTLSTSLVYSETTLNPSGEKYIWYCFPASWSGEPKFYLGGFDTGGWVEETKSFVNASGGSTTYRMFRSPNKYTIPVDFRVILQ